MKQLPLKLHDFKAVESIFASQKAFRGEILKFNEGIDLVAGEVNGKTFVMEAAQAEELIKNALDERNLIAGLNP